MLHALRLSSMEDLCPCTYCKSLPLLNRGQATKIHPAIFVEKVFRLKLVLFSLFVLQQSIYWGCRLSSIFVLTYQFLTTNQ